MRHHHSHGFLSFLFNRSQQPEGCFLDLCQSFHLRNVHPFVGPVASQGVQARTSLPIPEFNGSVITTTGNGPPIRTKSH